MPALKFSKTAIDRLTLPERGQVLYWDSSHKGFGIRLTPGGKTYFVEARVNGKTCRVTIGRHGPYTVENALTKANLLLNQMMEGVNPNDRKREEAVKGVTLAEAFAEFKQSRTLRPKTVAIYDRVMVCCFPDWQTLPITSISKDMVEVRHKQLSNANGPRGKGEAQAHQAMRTLRAVLNYASVKYEDARGIPLLAVNPVKRLTDIRAWNRIPRRQTVIQHHQLKPWAKAVAELENSDVRDYLLLLLFTGLRRTEAASLKWSDIDFAAKTLTISGDRTKNHDEHRLPLSKFLVQLLNNRPRQIDSVFIFPGEGSTQHLVEPKRQIKQIVDRSGVRFTNHDLRRTFLTVAEHLDVSHYALKRLANHRDSSDVTAGYIVNDVERLREPMEKISAFLVSKCGMDFKLQPKARRRRRN